LELSSIVSLFILALSPMVPLLLGSVGEIIIEKAGVVNIGIEGVFLLSALTSAMVSFFTGSLPLAIFVGVITGLGVGAIFAVIGVYLRGDQIVAGVGINLLAYGIGVIALFKTWNVFGASPPVATIPKWVVAGHGVSPMAPISVIIAVLAWFFLFRTNTGLKLRACGEEPRAAEAMGVNVMRMRLLATMLGSSLMGLAGAYLSIDWVGQFTRQITAGRGFIALANVAFSGWNPITAIVGAFIFGFFEALAIYLSISYAQPTLGYVFRTIPYIGTLLVVMIFRSRGRAPAALAKPYIKE